MKLLSPVKGSPVEDSDLLTSWFILRVANVTTLVAKSLTVPLDVSM